MKDLLRNPIFSFDMISWNIKIKECVLYLLLYIILYRAIDLHLRVTFGMTCRFRSAGLFFAFSEYEFCHFFDNRCSPIDVIIGESENIAIVMLFQLPQVSLRRCDIFFDRCQKLLHSFSFNQLY